MSRSHVDVNERRLRPVYDCLDNGNNKKALHEADKVLKKQKDFPCAKALKGLALLRLGRHDDSTVLLDDVHQQSPTDESTLQAMAMAYREMHRLDLLANMYERASKARPDNEDLLTALFMAYVRIADYKRQQQTAMVLHRLQPSKNPYYFWAVMSIVMQARNDEKLATTMFLPLAEKMANKYITENRIEAEAEVQLYLLILELQKKWEAALVLIQSDLGRRYCGELMYADVKEGELLTKLNRWPEANRLYKRLLLKEPDQWKFYSSYLETVFKLIETEWQPSESSQTDDQPDYTVDLAMTFINAQIKAIEDASSDGKSRVRRSPYLAQMELQKIVKGRGTPLPYSSQELIWKYYDLLGSRSCCFSDIRGYFSDLLESSEQVEFVKSKLTNEPTEPCKEEPQFTDVKDLQRHLTVIQLYFCSGAICQLESADLQTFIRNLLTWYKQGLTFGENLLSTDMQPCDPYLLMAINTLCFIFTTSGDLHELWRAMSLLELGLQKSPSNFHFKILLIQLYGRLGAALPCVQLFEGMDVKHIQMDSIGYIVANHIARTGQLTAAGCLYDNMLRFFTSNQKDTAEYLISAYKFGAFHKIDEFLNFKSRLQHSIQYASATVERLLLDMVMETNSHLRTEQILKYMEIEPSKDGTEWDLLSDNRDHQVWSNCNIPQQVVSEDIMKVSFEEEKAWLRVRNLTIRCLAAAVNMGSHGNTILNEKSSEKREDMPKVLTDLITQLKHHLSSSSSSSCQYPIAGPYRTRLSSYLNLGLGDLLIDACRITCLLHQCVNNLHGKASADNNVAENIKFTVPGKITDLIHQHGQPLVDKENKINPQVTENLVLLTEMIGHVVLLSGVWHSLIKSVTSSGDKRGKKRKGPHLTLYPGLAEGFVNYVQGMEECVKKLVAAVGELNSFSSLSQLMSTLSVNDSPLENSTADGVWKKVEQSYQKTRQELESFLALKLQYLSTLKL